MEKMQIKTLATAGLVVVGLGQVASAVTPIPSASLQVSAVMNATADMGHASTNTPYNPRSAGGYNYTLDITTPGFARYPVGSGIVGPVDGTATESRMILPFLGANSTTYVLGSGGATSNAFQRLDFGTLDNPVPTTAASTLFPNSFDWVDTDTIIYSADNAAPIRRTLYLADVVANPFSVTPNTSIWGGGTTDSSLTPVSNRIRNVRVGDTYNGYAYYGDAGVVGSASFYAIDLATGTNTSLGSITTSGTGSFGLWTVKEAGGYLYVHTTDDGIFVYSMNSATSLGGLVEHHTKAELNALASGAGVAGGSIAQNWGFDVVDGGARMLLTTGPGVVIEIIPEPTSLGLLGLAGLALVRRRK